MALQDLKRIFSESHSPLMLLSEKRAPLPKKGGCEGRKGRLQEERSSNRGFFSSRLEMRKNPRQLRWGGVGGGGDSGDEGQRTKQEAVGGKGGCPSGWGRGDVRKIQLSVAVKNSGISRSRIDCVISVSQCGCVTPSITPESGIRVIYRITRDSGIMRCCHQSIARFLPDALPSGTLATIEGLVSDFFNC